MTRSLCLHVLVACSCAALFMLPRLGAQMQRNEDQPDYPGLDIQMTIGWDGRVDPDCPLPISLLVTNQSAELLEGELLLENPDTGEVIRAGQIAAGPRAVRKFSTIQALRTWFTIVARFTDGETVFWERTLPVSGVGGFSERQSYLFFVDDGGRALNLAGSIPEPRTDPQESPAAATPELPRGSFDSGQPGQRPVVPVAIRTWEFPRHHGPLTAGQGMVFDNEASADLLDQQQWGVVGRWLATGGIVFLPAEVDELRQAVVDQLPFAALSGPAGRLLVGAGEIRFYDGSLFDPGGNHAAADIARQLSASARGQLYQQQVSNRVQLGVTPRSAASLQKILFLFTSYLFATGLILFLGRRSAGFLSKYLATVILLTSVLAAGVGLSITASEGDLYWESISEIGAGGLVQVAGVQVTSAGGSQFQLQMGGPLVDLQVAEDVRRRTAFLGARPVVQRRQSSQPPFAISQSLLSVDQTDSMRVRVPVTPWNSRELTAQAFLPLPGNVSVDLQFVSRAGTSGDWVVAVTNDTDLLLDEMALHLVWCRQNSGDSVGQQSSFYYADFDLNSTGEEISQAFINVPWFETNWVSEWHARMVAGEVTAWLDGTLVESPALILEDSDFVEYRASTHRFFVRLQREELPESFLEFVAESAAGAAEGQ